ncbi:MAG: recombinase family protein [Clostridia bacterium]|nr:recombinase family protein [Clostridia bacterium]
MPKNYGFARCSLAEEKGQDINRQVRELKAAGADEIISERVHGDAKVKPQLDFLLENIEPNSTIDKLYAT